MRDTTDEVVRASLQALLDAIAKQLESVERSVKEHLAATSELHTNLQLLTTIVGIGAVTMAKVLSEFSELAQYESAKAAAADVGLTPSHFESGTSVRRRSRMSKLGKAGIRAALYWPAITAMTGAYTEYVSVTGVRSDVVVVGVGGVQEGRVAIGQQSPAGGRVALGRLRRDRVTRTAATGHHRA